MKRDWTVEELIDAFSLTADELVWVSGGADYNQLGLALLLKFFQREGRFPEDDREIPPTVVDYIAQQIGVPASRLDRYDWSGRSQRDHRALIRVRLDFREATVDDEQRLAVWLSEHPALSHDQHIGRLKDLALEHLRDAHIEPPTPDRLDRFVRSGLRRFEERLFNTILERLSRALQQSLDDLVPAGIARDDLAAIQRSPMAQLKGDPGALGLKSVLREVDKLEKLQAIHLPDGLFADLSPKIVQQYQQRAAAEPPNELRHHPAPTKYMLLAAFCWQRRREVTDNLVELLIQITHKMSFRAEKRVEHIALSDIRQVHGKGEILYRLAVAALEQPDGSIRDVLFPVVSEEKLRSVVEERMAQGSFQYQVHTRLRGSYSRHYRQMLPAILKVLEFRSNNASHQPVIQALDLVRRYVSRKHLRDYPAWESIPIDDVIRPGLQEYLVERDESGNARVNRINYEICVLQALRNGLRSKEIWVVGADRYRNPDEDLPADFESQRDLYYAELRQPLNAHEFTTIVRKQMREALARFDQGLPDNPFVSLSARQGGWIKVSPSPAQPEPPMLIHLGREIDGQWGMTNLLDIFKEAALRIGFDDEFKSVASREHLDPRARQKRLLLCLYALGTNAGIRQISLGEHGEKYDDLLYFNQRFIRKENLRAANARVVDATLEARQSHIWGEGSMAVACDQRKFPTRGENLMTEWHPRQPYGKGIAIYWHVERRSVAVYAQLKPPLASEVAAMIQGVLHHLTTLPIQRAYVDTRGQSEVGFAFTYLLGFDLLPRLKDIHEKKLYRPDPGYPDAYPNLQSILTRPIQWEPVEHQYDEMIKHSTALRLGTADADAILKRFTRANLLHPTYQALAELGRAVQTIYLCNVLHSEPLRREIHEALNVIESWNSGMNFVRFGRAGEFASARLEDQEISALSLQLLMNCLVYVNTLMIQRVLSFPGWLDRMTPADWRGVTPLIYRHVNPYGVFRLDLDERLLLPEG